MSADPRYYTGSPVWTHDDECSPDNLCGSCWDAEEDRRRSEEQETMFPEEEEERLRDEG